MAKIDFKLDGEVMEVFADGERCGFVCVIDGEWRLADLDFDGRSYSAEDLLAIGGRIEVLND